MSIIILSQTAIKIGEKLAEVRKMRVNTHVDHKGVANPNTWRDTTAPDGTIITDAVETLKSQGYAIVEDKRPITVRGDRKYTTRIIRLTKVEAGAEEPQPEPTPEEPKPAKPPRKPRGKKNVEQMEEQLA